MTLTSSYKREDVLYYSPSVKVHAAVRKWSYDSGDGSKDPTSSYSWEYCDLSDDIVSVNVSLAINNESTFTLVLQNTNGKYTDFFHDQDRVTISCYKDSDEEIRLITGHVTASDAFQLYGESVRVSGSCPIHQMKLHYWDPNSVSSYTLLENAQEVSQNGGDTDMTQTDGVLKTLLSVVMGWSDDRIHISGIPEQIVEAATQLYVANKDIILGEVQIDGKSLVDGSDVTMAEVNNTKVKHDTKEAMTAAGEAAMSAAKRAISRRMS